MRSNTRCRVSWGICSAKKSAVHNERERERVGRRQVGRENGRRDEGKQFIIEISVKTATAAWIKQKGSETEQEEQQKLRL